MKKLIVIALVGALSLAVIPGVATAGGPHGNDLAAGLVLGATATVVGGVLLGAFAPPVVYAPPPPPVMYVPSPPVVYAPAPPVVFHAPRVIYRPAPVVIYRGGPSRNHWHPAPSHRGRNWNRH